MHHKQLSDTEYIRNRFIFLLVLCFPSYACAQTQSWNGTYIYEVSLGENVAEDKILIEYTLTLDKNNCVITSQGYQTDEKILCTTTESDGNLVVTFSSYEGGSTKNIYEIEVYPPHSTLFTLTQKNSTLITTWGTLAPDESFSTGEHFAKKAN